MKQLTGLALAFIVMFGGAMARSAELPFDQAAFDAARSAGKPVAVAFHAEWCPVCRAQAPVLKELAATTALQPLTLFVADYDTEKALRKSLAVFRQSTVVVFKNGKEVGRSTGSVGRKALEPLLLKAVQ